MNSSHGKCVLVGLLDMVDIGVLDSYSEAFGLPVVAFTTLEFIEKQQTEALEAVKKNHVVHSFPQFFHETFPGLKRMGMDELDGLQATLEQELGIVNNTLLTTFSKSYSKFTDYSTYRAHQVLVLLFAKRLLDQCAPVGFFNSRGTYLFNVIANACTAKGIPALHTRMDSFTMSRIYFSDSKGTAIGMRGIFENLSAVGLGGYDKQTIKDAEECYQQFVGRPTRAQVVENNSRNLLKNVRTAVKTGLGSVLRSARLWRENECDRTLGELDNPCDTIPRWPRKALRMAALQYSDILTKNPDYKRKFLYVPLHMFPDTTDLYFGRDYTHHEGFIAQLAKRVPSEYVLYVKDHTSMIGNRPLSFYKNLKALPNVEMIAPAVSTFDLIRGAACVVTVAGTAGWEALLLGKPVVVLGDIFYNCLPHVLHCSVYDPAFTDRMRTYIRDFSTSKEHILNAIRAFFLCSHPVGEGHDGIHDNTDVVARREARLVAEFHARSSAEVLAFERAELERMNARNTPLERGAGKA